MGKTEKLRRILACPECHSNPLQFHQSNVICADCSSQFPIVDDTPLLLKQNSPICDWYLKDLEAITHPTLKAKIKAICITPDDRLWSRQAKRTIHQLLKNVNPDHPDNVVINVGVGIERIFKKAFSPYLELIRVGLPHSGKVDAYGDAMDYPIADNSVDLLFSSSVIEHLENPELAIREIHRILKPNGIVYAEIEFMRALHMDPHDFTRYTIPGIVSVFERNGFTTIDKGISSGPFTATALFIRDFAVAITPTPAGHFATRCVTSWIVQPIKYLDWLVENHKLSNTLANNLFYVGTKK